MITVFFNRKTGEAFATNNEKFTREVLFAEGYRKEADFTVATSSGMIRIQKRGKLFDVTTIDNPAIL